MSDPDLTALVVKAQQGNRAAFEKIVQGTARLVYAQIVAVVRDRHRAEDLTQETYVAAWKGLASVQEPAGFISWLLTIARNTTLDGLKHDSRRKRNAAGHSAAEGMKIGPATSGEEAAGAGAAGVATEEASPPEAVALAEAREQALRLLEGLPEDYRLPLSMRYLAGADYYTIRRTLNLSDGALRGLLSRGMAILRERMSNLERERR